MSSPRESRRPSGYRRSKLSHVSRGWSDSRGTYRSEAAGLQCKPGHLSYIFGTPGKLVISNVLSVSKWTSQPVPAGILDRRPIKPQNHPVVALGERLYFSALLRMKTTASRTALFGPYALDVHSGELRKFGRRVKMGEQTFQILCLLLEHPGEVVTREELRAKLWADDTFVDFDHGLNSAIQRLRDCLSDSAENRAGSRLFLVVAIAS